MGYLDFRKSSSASPAVKVPAFASMFDLTGGKKQPIYFSAHKLSGRKMREIHLLNFKKIICIDNTQQWVSKPQFKQNTVAYFLLLLLLKECVFDSYILDTN